MLCHDMSEAIWGQVVQPSVKNLVRDSSVFVMAGGKENDWGKATIGIFKLSQSQLSKAVKLKKCEQNKLQKYWHYSIRVIRKFSCHISQKLTNIQQKMNLNSVTMVISRLLVSGRDARWWISSQKVSKLRIIGETYVLSYFNILYVLLLLNKQCDFLSWKAFLLRRISISRTLSSF